MTIALMDGALRQPRTIPEDRQGRNAVPQAPQSPILSRSGLSRAMRELAQSVEAHQFCLADMTHSHSEHPPRLLASNWTFDAIEIIGAGTIEQIYQSEFGAPLGEVPAAFETGSTRRLPRVVDETTALRLLEYGHGEIFVLRLRAGLKRGACVFSAPVTGRIRRDTLRRAHLSANYLFSRCGDAVTEAANDPLSERERECLRWVAEGKTTEDIALILGVSGNTVNKYIVSSIQKLSAGNRTMAVAIALRTGLI